jgi:hypothetical protein
MNEDPENHPTRQKLLMVLSGTDTELSKTDLATRVYGESNSSTRAMTTRATAALLAAGLLEERLHGRERLVRLSARGQALVRKWANKPQTSQWRDIDEALRPPHGGHPGDRQRFHLRHAALLALGNLRARGVRSDADDHYQQVLLALIDEPSDPASDLKFFRDHLAPTWPRHDVSRLLLAECILRFQVAERDKRERRSTFSDLILIGDAFGDDLTRDPYLQPADVLIWATCATAVAHHHLLEPDSEFRRISARGVVQRVAGLLGVLEKKAQPAYAVALGYRRALAGKVAYGSWEWQTLSHGEATPSRHPRADAVSEAIASRVEAADLEVLASAEANQVIDRYELALTQGPGLAVVRALPDAEPFFHRIHRRDVTKELGDWAHHYKGELAEIQRRAVARDPHTADQLRVFDAQATRLAERHPNIAAGLAPHLRQCAFLLGTPSTRSYAQASPAPRTADDHAAMVLNNLWTPEMVVADVATTVL